ncbi:MAG: FAD-dependent oxidoreductase [Thaumarchaeota archaeon]|jgi:sarcosine oxidase subunit alpha|nr:FAD-dependent oxidoreductase [Candidatus Geocrenenecus arthurdayi]
MSLFGDTIQERRGSRVRIFFRGVGVEGYTLEPVSIALYHNGFKVLSRSKKLYRVRGFYSLSPQDRLVLTRVGSEYVNPCEVFCQEGQEAHVDLSVPFLVKLFTPLLDGYFQHRRLLKNKILWSLAADKIKKLANHPRIGDIEAEKTGRILEVKSDVVVVGGGLSGLVATYTTSKLGLRVLLIDDSPALGGRMRYDHMDIPGISMPRENLLQDLLNKVNASGNVSILTRTVFTGFFEDHPTAYSEYDKVLYVLKAKAYIIATGLVDVPCIFRNNDLPGVFSGSTVLEMVNYYGVEPGRRGLIIGLSQNSLRIAEQLKRLGIDIVLVSHSKPEEVRYDLSKIGEYVGSVKEIQASGKTCVERVNIIHDNGRDEVKVDFIACSAFSTPDVRILNQLDSKIVFLDNVGFIPIHDEYMHLKDNIFIAGGVSGSPYSILHLIEGEIAALSVAYKLGVKDAEPLMEEKIREYRLKLSEMNLEWKNKIFEISISGLIENTSFSYPPTLFIEKPRRDAFICFCEDVTTKDISRTVYEKGYRTLELVKRSLGVCTGRCQGRLCMVNSALYVSYLSNLDPNQVGLTKARAPTTPIPLHVLAGGEGG